MERVGICSICGSVSKQNTCSICGRLVCSNCFDFSRSVCIQCSGSRPISDMSSERTGFA